MKVLLLWLLAAQLTPDYTLFTDCRTPGGYFYSNTNTTGTSWVKNLSGKLPNVATPAFTPGSALELSFNGQPAGRWEAKVLRHPIRGLEEWDNGVFIQKRATPFGRPDYLQLRVYSTGETPFKANNTTIQPLPGRWITVKLPLKIQRAEDLKEIVFEQSQPGENQVFLDDLEVRQNDPPPLSEEPQLLEATGLEKHVELRWKPTHARAVLIERNGVPVGAQTRLYSRYTDPVEPGNYTYRIRLLGYDDKLSPYSAEKTAKTHPFTDDELMDATERACLRYYWEGAESNSGLALESIPGDPHMVAIGASGFGIMALVAGTERGLLPKPEVSHRLGTILTFLEKADRFHGVFPHYIDGRTGKVIAFFGDDDNGGDLVETSFLMQGLLAARTAFPEHSARITKLWEAVEWDWYYRKPFLVWHWSPDKGFKINHPLIGWNETFITYFLALASPTHKIPAEAWYQGWASQSVDAQNYRGGKDGKLYSNGNVYHGVTLPVGGFSGGPLFFTHYSFMGLDPHGLHDKYADYWQNNEAIARINLRYCEANGYGDRCWGLTASDGPFGYHPDEPRKETDKRKLTPTGAVASMPYLPEASKRALRSYYRDYGHFLWGEYGFRDAFSPEQNWCNELYMGLNQAPMVVMLENYRTGAVWKLFEANPEVKLARAGGHFQDGPSVRTR